MEYCECVRKISESLNYIILHCRSEEVRHPRVKGNVLHTHSLGVKVQYNVECVCGWHAVVVPPLIVGTIIIMKGEGALSMLRLTGNGLTHHIIWCNANFINSVLTKKMYMYCTKSIDWGDKSLQCNNEFYSYTRTMYMYTCLHVHAQWSHVRTFTALLRSLNILSWRCWSAGWVVPWRTKSER